MQEGNLKIGSITSHDADNNPQQTLFILKRQRPLLNNYNVIPDEKRFRLIEMVNHRRMKVKEASQILNINYQTAKSILRRFSKSGAIYRSYNNAMQASSSALNSSNMISLDS